MEKIQEQRGADQLIAELDNVYKKIASDLKKVGDIDPDFTILTNETVMESVIKLTNIVDKIKKIGTSGQQEDDAEQKPAQKVRNLQDWTLSKKKA